jgi:hypothetical protein
MLPPPSRTPNQPILPLAGLARPARGARGRVRSCARFVFFGNLCYIIPIRRTLRSVS